MDRSRRGMSLVEIVVVVAVVLVLTALLLAEVANLRTEANTLTCMNNLRQVSQAMEMYQQDCARFPEAQLRECLDSYIPDANVWICPEDRYPEGDSYSEFFVMREDEDTQEVQICCPRHRSHSVMTGLFGMRRVEKRELATIKHNDVEIAAGDEVGEGVLDFEDGSKATVTPAAGSSEVNVIVLSSFRKADGTIHTILKVEGLEDGTVDVEVTPGSRFEVITPSAIMGVRGTKFRVVCHTDATGLCTVISVSEGAVEVTPLNVPAAVVLGVGASGDAVTASQALESGQMDVAVYVAQMRNWASYLRPGSKTILVAAGQEVVTAREVDQEEQEEIEEVVEKQREKRLKRKEYRRKRRWRGWRWW